MAEEESRTGDPAADAPPPPKGSLAGNWGCIAIFVVFAILIALFIGNR